MQVFELILLLLLLSPALGDEDVGDSSEEERQVAMSKKAMRYEEQVQDKLDFLDSIPGRRRGSVVIVRGEGQGGGGPVRRKAQRREEWSERKERIMERKMRRLLRSLMGEYDRLMATLFPDGSPPARYRLWDMVHLRRRDFYSRLKSLLSTTPPPTPSSPPPQ